jgi:putative transposase
MARLARVVVPELPHHVIHRGNRRQNVFFRDEDKESYLSILHLQSRLFALKVWSYCLMDNHVHLIVVPKDQESLSQVIGETHKLYTRMVNFREGWRGSLWEGRFKSMVMDERYVCAAVRYVERNPVRAKVVKKAEEYLWSSARFRVKKQENPLLSDFYLLEEIGDWSKYLEEEENKEQLGRMRLQCLSGRPLGDMNFLRNLEQRTGRALIKRRPGPQR